MTGTPTEVPDVNYDRLPTVSTLDDIVLGHYYRDAVSGWVGVATSRYEYLNGCVRVCLDAMKDGKPEGQVFDWQQLQRLDRPPVVLAAQVPAVGASLESVPEPQERRRTGGPQTHTPVAR